GRLSIGGSGEAGRQVRVVRRSADFGIGRLRSGTGVGFRGGTLLFMWPRAWVLERRGFRRGDGNGFGGFRLVTRAADVCDPCQQNRAEHEYDDTVGNEPVAGSHPILSALLSAHITACAVRKPESTRTPRSLGISAVPIGVLAMAYGGNYGACSEAKSYEAKGLPFGWWRQVYPGGACSRRTPLPTQAQGPDRGRTRDP